ncbi:hypothetical protein [Pseudooceanicola algae]|uniref:Uncharacterized protein n=1 Tax=Pseudooceanicola algae TaxID=1537215 RepID=A0A418SKP9_9RHOB|nr:hypothetical protein [Pseudooceanicola algae]QPM90727.1 hypothetical protein PSAL_019660 [Pseudooceanicola algae]
MIRPEIEQQIRRWREALVGLAVMLPGLWWLMTSFGLLRWIGLVVTLAGAAMVFAGVQRGRFRGDSGGPGVVEIREGQIGYFGPFTGGAVALSEMTRLALDPGQDPPCWRLSQYGQDDLMIPLTAEGADGLFDIFAALPGIRTGRLVSEVQRVIAHDAAEVGTQAPLDTAPVVIWDRSQLRLN